MHASETDLLMSDARTDQGHRRTDSPRMHLFAGRAAGPSVGIYLLTYVRMTDCVSVVGSFLPIVVASVSVSKSQAPTLATDSEREQRKAFVSLDGRPPGARACGRNGRIHSTNEPTSVCSDRSFVFI